MGLLKGFNMLMSIKNLLNGYGVWCFPNLFNNSIFFELLLWGYRKAFVKCLAEE